MTTARDIITLSLNDAGVTGQGLTPGASDINNSLTRLNDMMEQWSEQRWIVFHLVATDLAMTGATFYTVGTGGQFNIERPSRLEAARIIQNTPPNPNDVGWPMELVQSMEAYNNIRLQHLGSFPRFVFLDSDYPLGKVYFWPLPSSLYTGRIITKAHLQTFPNLSTVFNLPPMYRRAIRFNLVEELIDAYGLPEKPGNSRRAMAALNIIKNANAQIPVLQLPPDLVRPGLYNIFTDNAI